MQEEVLSILRKIAIGQKKQLVDFPFKDWKHLHDSNIMLVSVNVRGWISSLDDSLDQPWVQQGATPRRCTDERLGLNMTSSLYGEPPSAHNNRETCCVSQTPTQPRRRPLRPPAHGEPDPGQYAAASRCLWGHRWAVDRLSLGFFSFSLQKVKRWFFSPFSPCCKQTVFPQKS